MAERAGPCSVTFMGNACVLIDVADAVILTDPWFGISPGIVDPSGLDRGALPRLTALIGSHWASDHWEIDGFADYPWKTSTPVYVADPSMADRARAVGFEQVQTMAWGERLRLTPSVELEAVVEHSAPDGMRTNNYAITSPNGRIFFGGETLDVAAVGSYARTADPFDVIIGPVNGARFRGRQLVTTADEMVTVTELLGASTLIPIHDGHLPYEGLVEVISSRRDLRRNPAGSITVVDLEPGDRWTESGAP